MPKTLKGRVGWEVLKRLLKAIPYVGTVVSVGFAGHEIKKKGIVPGVIHVGLDVTPVVGTAKNVVEIFTGDWIPDKAPKAPAANGTPQIEQSQIQQPQIQQPQVEQPKSGGKPTFPT